jgi:hypothetical protein
MKKILILVSLLIVAAACAAPPANPPTVETNRNTNVAETASALMSEADAIAKEKAIWETIKQKDYAGFAGMLADDHVGVLYDGVFNKAETLESIKQFEPSEVTFSDWKFLPIDKDGYVVAYTTVVKGKYQGKDIPLESVRNSSAWVRRSNKWVAPFHQECPVKKLPPPPPPPKAAKPGPSPATSPVAATPGPDPIANEKMVWELFKSRNYGAFAELLAPESLEVAPDNYYDKAGSVKGVSMFDASKAELSDFKTAKLNENSSLVTYLVKNAGPDPNGERHTTIWVYRGGKWLGLFHHGGTPVQKPAATPAASPTTKPVASPTVK